MVADAAIRLDATVLLVGQGMHADALARRLPREGVEIERVAGDQVARAARVTTPDLIVVAGDSAGDGGKRVLALLASDASMNQPPVLVIRGSSSSRGASVAQASVAELALDGGPALCAQRIHALIEDIAQHGLQGRKLQHTIDAITGVSRPPAQPNAAPQQPSVEPATGSEQPRSREIARSPTLVGVPITGSSVTPPRSGSFRRQSASDVQAMRSAIPLSAFAAVEDDRPIAATIPPARENRASRAPAAAAPDGVDVDPTTGVRAAVTAPPTTSAGAAVTAARTSAAPPASRARAQVSAAPPASRARAQVSAAPPARAIAAAAALARRVSRPALIAAAALALVAVAAAALAVFGGDGSKRAAPAAAAGSLATAAPPQANAQPRTTREAERGRDPAAVQTDESASPDRERRLALADHYMDAGHRLFKRKKFVPAQAAYLRALRAFPDYPRAMVGLVRTELQRNRGAEAVRWARRLVAVQPKRGINQLLLGDAWALQGESSLARAAWRRAANYGNATARKRLKKPASIAR